MPRGRVGRRAGLFCSHRLDAPDRSRLLEPVVGSTAIRSPSTMPPSRCPAGGEALRIQAVTWLPERKTVVRTTSNQALPGEIGRHRFFGSLPSTIRSFSQRLDDLHPVTAEVPAV